MAYHQLLFASIPNPASSTPVNRPLRRKATPFPGQILLFMGHVQNPLFKNARAYLVTNCPPNGIWRRLPEA